MAQETHLTWSPTTIHILNDDILQRIFDHLHFDDKIRLRRTCSRWRQLLDRQIGRTKSLRMGQFQQGGYHITSGLLMQCSQHCRSNHRQLTGTLCNGRVLNLPADPKTQCFSINQYDYLHRALKHCHNAITSLSLGRLEISYRLLIVITHNLPHLEHLELIACASDFFPARRGSANKSEQASTNDLLSGGGGGGRPTEASIPSLESFNSPPVNETYYSMMLFNQHHDEQVNMSQRLLRSAMVKSCELVKESKDQNYWPNLRHLMVKDCYLLDELSLSLIMAITSQSLEQLTIESNQYLTGEFLNYCGPRLQILKMKHCPLMQVKFLEDLVKLRQLLASTSPQQPHQHQPPINNKQNVDQDLYPQPIDISTLRSSRNFNQAIYCTL